MTGPAVSRALPMARYRRGHWIHVAIASAATAGIVAVFGYGLAGWLAGA